MNAKKKLTVVLFMITFVVTYIFSHIETNRRSLNELLHSNIEALAEEEGGYHPWYCAGSGSLDCPSGKKVASVIYLYSLDIYE